MSLRTMFILDKAQYWDRGECWGSVHLFRGKTSLFLCLCLLCISEHHHRALNSSMRWIWVQRRNFRPGQIVLRTGSVKEFDVGLGDYLWKSAMAQVQSLLAGFLESKSVHSLTRTELSFFQLFISPWREEQCFMFHTQLLKNPATLYCLFSIQKRYCLSLPQPAVGLKKCYPDIGN